MGGNLTECMANVAEIGVRFRRYRSRAREAYMAEWRNGEGESRVYQVEIAGTAAVFSADGREVFTLRAGTRGLARRLGLKAARAYLVRTHRHAVRTARADAVPEEEGGGRK
ncbi:MAG: hypothetical protein J6334_02535 [Kiritimatiellae bacterium]|nr:hypothetical protein [Kiritimatiellia bacterium]